VQAVAACDAARRVLGQGAGREDVLPAHFVRMAHAVEVDVALEPADVDLLRATGIVFEADGIPSASSGKAQTRSKSSLGRCFSMG
jgi:hypothetical protein